MEYKSCSVCKEIKPLEMFNKLSTAKTGRTPSCKVCKRDARNLNKEHISTQKKNWYDKNKERVLTEAKEDRKESPLKYQIKEQLKYLKHREKILKRVGGYQKKNPDVYRKAGVKYRKLNPHLSCMKAAKYRATKVQATPKWIKDEFESLFIFEIYHLSKLRREIGINCHVDHIVPLVSNFVCGLHCAANLQLLAAFENESKGNRYWPDMW